ncbi:hypothetical protein sscle_11g084930 [Sclerotinia sclerotiorum 1980 UF-70]|uniref:FAD-binding PCMH-type domain-containing protein n=1 Tax=Sclerotinia sclerotiorum (strain ATCC 18683 / 1980 / Ss-1) TaxID=665079 RepID=A0A1D9QGG3_SCLS1|nr:hypothetical protein sscle_11g084930 [Sclerotinia sclerotiorum 1980 UF-70]
MRLLAPLVEDLKAGLSPEALVLLKGDEGYDEGIARWSRAAEKKAALVVFPTTSEDVSKIVLFAKEHKFEFAVVGGGHGSSGASSTHNGLSINLSKMRNVIVDPVTKSARCQGGCLWSDVDTAAFAHGLAAVGGTVNHTGIGGLTLGGGFGYLTPKYGLVIDNLLEAEVVLADGRIVTCSEYQEPDLFWAIRGAGIGFGVATSFTYRLHPQPNRVWGGLLIFPREKLEAIVSFANTIMTLVEERAFLLLGIAAPPPAFQPAILIPVFYNGTEAEGRAYYKALLDLEPIANTTKEMDYVEVNSMINEPMVHGFRRNMKGAACMLPLTYPFAAEIFSETEKFFNETPDAKHTLVVFEYVPFGKILQVGQQDTAFANRGAYGNLLLGAGWEQEETDQKCREWCRMMAQKAKVELERRLKEGTDEITKDGVGAYSNYDGANHEGGRLVYGVNYPRLAELKKKYDPENLFSKGPDLVS